jgi:L,D-peptidoglycan transpeptidase YkuD (ErfK/YbiS/YcfS/YnhG family)
MVSPLIITHNRAFLGNKIFSCTIGRNHFKQHKVEGDGATPLGTFPMRMVWYRSDRIQLPKTVLPVRAMTQMDGWCDDTNHPWYNKAIRLPFCASHEVLWRDDGVYDIVIVVGYNDAPVIPNKGSAIFMHLQHQDNRATVGCAAFIKEDLLYILDHVSPCGMVRFEE